MWLFKHHEFWPGRLFELPGYFYLAWQCFVYYQIGPKTLLKVNPGIDHSGFGFASKYDIQQAVLPKKHPQTCFLKESLSDKEKLKVITDFAQQTGWPIIIKPDRGLVGKGVFKLADADQAGKAVTMLQADYLVQEYVSLPLEFGVFIVRCDGSTMVTAINQKHFPTVIGDGHTTILELAQKHERYTHYWQSWLKSIDTNEVLKKDEERRISYIGSHTLGCMFTNDNHLITPQLTKHFDNLFSDTKSFYYGRLDVSAKSIAEFQQGNFQLLEVNGVSSLPTNMFDPRESIWQAYRILFQHFKLLARAAHQQRHTTPTTPINSLWYVIKRTWQTTGSMTKQQNILECNE